MMDYVYHLYVLQCCVPYIISGCNAMQACTQSNLTSSMQQTDEDQSLQVQVMPRVTAMGETQSVLVVNDQNIEFEITVSNAVTMRIENEITITSYLEETLILVSTTEIATFFPITQFATIQKLEGESEQRLYVYTSGRKCHFAGSMSGSCE